MGGEGYGTRQFLPRNPMRASAPAGARILRVLALLGLAAFLAGCPRAEPQTQAAGGQEASGGAAPKSLNAAADAAGSQERPGRAAVESRAQAVESTEAASADEGRAPDPGRAVLKAGPRIGRGIDSLPANVLDYQRAEYAVTEGVIVVYYLASGAQLWEPQSSYRCDGELLTRVATLEGRAHVHANPLADGGWLLVRFPEGFDDPCIFVTPFLRQLRFFRRAAREDPLIPFPAFLDLDR